jgi:8-amino-7-oxononanoate synthase
MTHWLDDELSDRKREGLYRVRRPLQSAPGAQITLHGRAYLNCASNDYLNLATDPRLARAAARAARRFGCGGTASPLLAGYLPPLHALERALARWQQTEAALVFSSGFAANLGTITALAGPDDAIFSDQLNHASLIDGCRLSRSRVCIYRHGDVNDVQELLAREGPKARRRLIVTDSVFSMDGDLAPLADLLDLANRYEALLLVDEAHATGVLGEEGRGVTALLPVALSRERLVKMGTLSKALGAQGGFVCGSRQLIAWLVNYARPYIYSTALAPPSAAAARRAIQVVQREPERRLRLLGMASALRAQLLAQGWPATASRSAILPLMVGESRQAVALAARLRRQGILAPAIRPPTVPEGTARLRISLTAGHTKDDLEHLLAALLREGNSLS